MLTDQKISSYIFSHLQFSCIYALRILQMFIIIYHIRMLYSSRDCRDTASLNIILLIYLVLNH